MPAFTQLFLDKKNMMAWSDFISLPEEKQEQYLQELNRRDSESDRDEEVEKRLEEREIHYLQELNRCGDSESEREGDEQKG